MLHLLSSTCSHPQTVGPKLLIPTIHHFCLFRFRFSYEPYSLDRKSVCNRISNITTAAGDVCMLYSTLALVPALRAGLSQQNNKLIVP